CTAERSRINEYLSAICGGDRDIAADRACHVAPAIADLRREIPRIRKDGHALTSDDVDRTASGAMITDLGGAVVRLDDDVGAGDGRRAAKASDRYAALCLLSADENCPASCDRDVAGACVLQGGSEYDIAAIGDRKRVRARIIGRNRQDQCA